MHRSTLKGLYVFNCVCDTTFMRPLQRRIERVLGLPWAASRLGGTCPRLLQISLSGYFSARR